MNLESYCASQDPSWIERLRESSRSFVESLGLPLVHPFCNDNVVSAVEESIQIDLSHDSFLQETISSILMTLSPLVAFVELWFRLLAGLVAPVGCFLLLRNELQRDIRRRKKRESRLLQSLSILTLLCSLIVMVDSLYVMEYGCPGFLLFLTSLTIAIRMSWRNKNGCTSLLILLLVLFSIWLTFDYKTFVFHLGHPKEVDIRIQPGLYYNHSHPIINATVSNWPLSKRTYQDKATPWMYTGDARTGLPYFLNYMRNPEWRRVFLPLDDGEAVALDISFPKSGFCKDNPVLLVLHGVNGGSSEGYVQDLALRANATVVVMVSRGLMDLPTKGWNLFHGARLTDVHQAATALRRAMGPDQLLAGVGYSMGAIVLNNYVASYGSKCPLDAAFSVSGALECRTEQYYMRSQRLWQPMIADYMRHNILLKFKSKVQARINMRRFKRATNVVALDACMSEEYHGIGRVEKYYSQMGAFGDTPFEGFPQPPPTTKYRFENIAVPTCILHAFDDPISTWRTIVENEGLKSPTSLVKRSPNLLFLLTRKGGHVGWPVGWIPWTRKWEFVSEAVVSFVDAVGAAKKKKNDKSTQAKDSLSGKNQLNHNNKSTWRSFPWRLHKDMKDLSSSRKAVETTESSS